MPTEPFKKSRVVLNHGYLDDPTVWREVAAALEARASAPSLRRLPGTMAS